MAVKNTFIHIAPTRSPSLDAFFCERLVQSCPGSPSGRHEARAAAALAALAAASSSASSSRAPSVHEDQDEVAQATILSPSPRKRSHGGGDEILEEGWPLEDVLDFLQLYEQDGNEGLEAGVEDEKICNVDPSEKDEQWSALAEKEPWMSSECAPERRPEAGVHADCQRARGHDVSRHARTIIPMLCVAAFAMAFGHLLVDLRGTQRPLQPPQSLADFNEEGSAPSESVWRQSFENALPITAELRSSGGFGAWKASEEALLLGTAAQGLAPVGAEHGSFGDAVEGMSGLMRRLEQLQPLLGSAEAAEGSAVATMASEGHRMRLRFAELVARMRRASDAGRSFLSAEQVGLFEFHRDLALFVAQVEIALGISGPLPEQLIGHQAAPGQLLQGARLDDPVRRRLQDPVRRRATLDTTSRAGPSATGTPSQVLRLLHGGEGSSEPRRQGRAEEMVQPATSRRVQEAMRAVVAGVQHFEALQPRLRQHLAAFSSSASDALYGSIVQRGRILDEELFALQHRGVQLASQKTFESEGQAFAAALEAFAKTQALFADEIAAALSRPSSAPAPLPSRPPPTPRELHATAVSRPLFFSADAAALARAWAAELRVP